MKADASRRHETLGRAAVLVGAFGFATLGIWNDLIVEHGGAAFTAVFVRFAFSAVGFAVLLAIRRVWLLDRGLVVRAVAMGTLQFAAVYCLFEGFANAPVSLVILLFYVYPLVATVGAAALLHEPLGARHGVVLALGLAGIALSVGAPSDVKTLGIVLGLLAGVTLGLNVVAGRHLMTAWRGSPFDVVPLMFLGPGIGLAVIAVPLGMVDLSLSATGWGALAGLVLVGTVTPVMLFWGGVKLIGAGEASMLATLEPPLAVLLAYAVLGESLSALQLLGGAMVVAAVVLLSLPTRTTRPQAAA